MALTRVGDILDPKQNNFTLLRLLAASAVVISHAVFLHSGHKADEILSSITYFNLGDHAVNVFFVLSGLTVTGSLVKSPSTTEFMVARGLRIFPALGACALLLVLVGTIVTTCTPTQFLSDTRVWRYGVSTLLLNSAATGLPGVFAGNPHPSVMNASIWTLKYEAACYVLLAFVAWFGFVTKRRFTWLFGLSWTIAGGILFVRSGHDTTPLDQAARFWLCFSLGVGFYVFRNQIVLSAFAVAAVSVLFWFTIGSPLERIVSLFATGYAIVWLGKLPTGHLRSLTNRIDLSYGIYIFGWPITQTLMLVQPSISVWSLILLSLVLAMAVALPSWLLIERPSMRARKIISISIEARIDRLRQRLKSKHLHEMAQHTRSVQPITDK